MMDKVQVSICIPAYEQPNNLQKCLESLEMQSFKDFEVIVTDDSKSNDLKVVVDSFLDKLNIKYFKNPVSLGSPENWNESIRHAIGKYIKILHHDDYFTDANSLEKMVKLLDENPDSKILFCSSRHVDSRYNYHSSHILDHKSMQKVKKNPQTLFSGNIIGAPSIMMYHRDIEIYFDKRMKWLVDIDFYIKVLRNNDFVYTKDELVNINVAEGGRVTHVCATDRDVNIREYILLFNKLSTTGASISYVWFFVKLFLKFDIRSESELRDIAYDGILNPRLRLPLRIASVLRPLFLLLMPMRKKNTQRHGSC